MKIILVNINAVTGSTGKIVSDIKNVLDGNGCECIIAYGNQETINDKNFFRYCNRKEQLFNNAISRLTGVPYGLYLQHSTHKLIRAIERESPDIVHIHCPNGYTVDLYVLLTFLADSGIRTVVTNHAEYWYTGNCGYAFDCNKWLSGCGQCPQYKFGKRYFHDGTSTSWRKMKRAFDRFDSKKIVITSVSPWVDSRSKQSPYLSRFVHKIVVNGVDTSIFTYQSPIKLLNQNKPIIFHATATFTSSPKSIKGGNYIIELARKMQDVDFIVAALSSNVEVSKLPFNVKLWGRITNQRELAQLYATSNCTLITSKRETFSMIVAESLCCGTPVVGFMAGGPESIAIPEYSKFVEYGNIVELETAVKKMIFTPVNKHEISLQAAELYSKERMTQEYLNIYNTLY